MTALLILTTVLQNHSTSNSTTEALIILRLRFKRKMSSTTHRTTPNLRQASRMLNLWVLTKDNLKPLQWEVLCLIGRQLKEQILRTKLLQEEHLATQISPCLVSNTTTSSIQTLVMGWTLEELTSRHLEESILISLPLTTTHKDTHSLTWTETK